MTLKERYEQQVGPGWDMWCYSEWLESRVEELEKERDDLKSELSITKMTLKFMETKP